MDARTVARPQLVTFWALPHTSFAQVAGSYSWSSLGRFVMLCLLSGLMARLPCRVRRFDVPGGSRLIAIKASASPVASARIHPTRPTGGRRWRL
jgi:hypothetical protein